MILVDNGMAQKSGLQPESSHHRIFIDSYSEPTPHTLIQLFTEDILGLFFRQ